MSFLRPGARAALWRWREALVGVLVVALGLWLGVDSFGLQLVSGAALVIFGAIVTWAGVERARFRVGHGGAGVVQLDERRITYFGPMQGGAVSLEALSKLELGPGANGVMHWHLSEPGRPALLIPVNAAGGEVLFDAFSALEGFDTGRMLAALNTPPRHPIVIWRKTRLWLH